MAFSKIIFSPKYFRKNNKNLIKRYLEEFTLNNNPKYPYFKENDCTNFVSQTIYENGIKQTYGNWNDVSSWFCKSRSSSDLYRISLTWRSSRYFRAHFKRDFLSINKKVSLYKEIPLNLFIKKFDFYCNIISTGSVIQYINLSISDYPYHSQVVYDTKKTRSDSDIYICQHTRDLFNYSLKSYLKNINCKDSIVICIYNFLY